MIEIANLIWAGFFLVVFGLLLNIPSIFSPCTYAVGTRMAKIGAIIALVGCVILILGSVALFFLQK